jgi:hypothetical protein
VRARIGRPPPHPHVNQTAQELGVKSRYNTRLLFSISLFKWFLPVLQSNVSQQYVDLVDTF